MSTVLPLLRYLVDIMKQIPPLQATCIWINHIFPHDPVTFLIKYVCTSRWCVAYMLWCVFRSVSLIKVSLRMTLFLSEMAYRNMLLTDNIPLVLLWWIEWTSSKTFQRITEGSRYAEEASEQWTKNTQYYTTHLQWIRVVKEIGYFSCF